MKPVMMKCGHASNSYQTLPDGSKIPSCAICAGIKGGYNEVADAPDFPLSGRKAKCFCGKTVDSDIALPFFKETRNDKFNSEYDSFYCGCRGWG